MQVYPKSDNDRRRLRSILLENILFQRLDDEQLDIVLDALSPVVFKDGKQVRFLVAAVVAFWGAACPCLLGSVCCRSSSKAMPGTCFTSSSPVLQRCTWKRLGNPPRYARLVTSLMSLSREGTLR